MLLYPERIILCSFLVLVSIYYITYLHIVSIYEEKNKLKFNYIKNKLLNVVKRQNRLSKQKPTFIDVDTGNSSRKVILDPLTPPFKSNYNFTKPSINRMPINIKTRPDGGDYQQVGVLHKESNVDLEFNKPGNSDETVILSLFGKPLYKGSTNWNYYVTDKNNNKIPLFVQNSNCTDETNGCSEIHTNDLLLIQQYNGNFRAQIYRFDSPKYIPYIY
jgi:hypothetical protein